VSLLLLIFFFFFNLIYVLNSSPHLLPTSGKSRESLPGETAIKALLAAMTGRDMNRGGAAPTPAAGAVPNKKAD